MSDRESPGNMQGGARPIPRSAVYRLSWQLVALVVILALPAAGQEAASQIKAEAERLQHSLKDKPVSYPGVPNANAMVGDMLKAALQAQSAGRLYLSLEDLSQLADFINGAWTAADKAEAVKSGLPAFEAEWEKANASVSALDRQARERNWNDARAAAQALSETAQGKTIPLLEGGRGFAVSTEPKDGLFHLGEAQGEAEFAAFCASLQLPRKGAPYPLRSFLPELEGLQKKTNAAFQPPRSIELHERFMALNSALKLAQELDASKSYAGALYQYLEAVLQYGMLDAISLDASQQSALKSALAAARQKLDASKRDDSIAQLFLERAESQVTHADGSAPSSDDWRSAQLILEQVLPAYYAADKPPATLERAANKTVDITLVRWPYT
jgi:hypothetical protein